MRVDGQRLGDVHLVLVLLESGRIVVDVLDLDVERQVGAEGRRPLVLRPDHQRVLLHGLEIQFASQHDEPLARVDFEHAVRIGQQLVNDGSVIAAVVVVGVGRVDGRAQFSVLRHRDLDHHSVEFGSVVVDVADRDVDLSNKRPLPVSLLILIIIIINLRLLYLAVAERRRVARHGGNVEQDERMSLVIQVRVGPDGAADRVDGEVAIRIARIDGIADCAVGTCTR